MVKDLSLLAGLASSASVAWPMKMALMVRVAAFYVSRQTDGQGTEGSCLTASIA
jgi:hypothetical protein